MEVMDAYLARVGKWIAEMREKGATEVVAMPVFAATEHRINQRLTAGAKPTGTAVSVVVDTQYSSPESLEAIAHAVSRLASTWMRCSGGS